MSVPPFTTRPQFPEMGPFANLYEEWKAAYPNPRDPAIEERLASQCRDAWMRDAPFDRESILYFVWEHADENLAYLIIEGLKASDRGVARVAATMACVTQAGVLNLGPDLRPVYRALVRRFPENDTVRPHELYGHEPDDLDDTAQRPCVNLYEDWQKGEHPYDPALTRQLVDTYRNAWATGDGVDRAFVLHFLLTNRLPGDPVHRTDGVDLVREALASTDPVLAPTAAFTAWCFAEDPDVDLGPGFRQLLEAHRGRFPEGPIGMIWSALRALNEREGVGDAPDPAVS